MRVRLKIVNYYYLFRHGFNEAKPRQGTYESQWYLTLTKAAAAQVEDHVNSFFGDITFMNDRLNTIPAKKPNIWNFLNSRFPNRVSQVNPPTVRKVLTVRESKRSQDHSSEVRLPKRAKRRENIRKSADREQGNCNGFSREESKHESKMCRPEESILLSSDPGRRIFDIRKVSTRLLSRKISKPREETERKPQQAKAKKERLDSADMSLSLNINDMGRLDAEFNYLNESSEDSQKEKEYLHVKNNLNITTTEENDCVYHAKDLKKALAECFSILSRNYIFNKHLSDIEFKQPAEGKNIKGVYEDMLKMFGCHKNECRVFYLVSPLKLPDEENDKDLLFEGFKEDGNFHNGIVELDSDFHH